MSPGRQALLRVVRDPLALGGAAVVVVIGFLCCFAPWFCSSPIEQRLWLGVTPPGGSHPAVPGQLHLQVGAPPIGDWTGFGQITIAVEESTHEDVRVRLRRGLLEIQKIAGAERLEQLDLDTLPARVLGPGDVLGAARRGQLVAGQPAPDGFFPAGESLLILRRSGPSAPVVWNIGVKAGRITSILRDAMPLTSGEIAGETVRSIAGDGRELRLTHPLGTDPLGRDIWARLLYGGRISLLVGLVATLVSVVIGVAVGAVAGFAGGRIDRWLMGAVDVLYAIPFIFLVILLMVTVRGEGGKNEFRDLLLLFAALGAVQWLTMARIVRGSVQSLAARDFVLAGRAVGLTPARLLIRHILPNCLGVIVVYATLTVPIVIMEESFLAFIGLGVSAGGVDAWGAQVDLGNQHIAWASGDRWWLLAAPVGAMVAVLAGLSLFGDRLRTHLDPKG